MWVCIDYFMNLVMELIVYNILQQYAFIKALTGTENCYISATDSNAG